MALSKIEAALRRQRHFLIKSDDAIHQIAAGIPEDYMIIGPVKEEWAVNYRPVKSVEQFAFGVISEEQPGSYQLKKDWAGLDLSSARSMTSPKLFTHNPQELLLTAHRDQDNNYQYETPSTRMTKQAFFGVRACDISGMRILDMAFTGQFRDPAYDKRRQDTIVVGLDCFKPGNNCFCSTFKTGPVLTDGFDIGLSYFGNIYLVEIATETGARIMADADVEPADPAMLEMKNKQASEAREAMSKAFDLKSAVKTLNDNYDHPYWNEPSERCLSCANCINVCPTCYCYQIVDKTSVDLSKSARSRLWDACQNLEFAAVHGGNFRPNRVDRLRQWVYHKLNWTIEQYGAAGCVGCGRCVTWCPASIDITEPVWRLGGRSVVLAE